jgi:hypothetical protein
MGQEFLDIDQLIEDLSHLRDFMPLLLKEYIKSGHPSHCTRDDLVGFSSNGAEYRTEYNDSCSCHPEWREDTITIHWGLIKDFLSNGPETIEKMRKSHEALTKNYLKRLRSAR